MNQNDNQNKKNGRGGKGSNMRGLLVLVAWALILTVALSYFGNYMNQSMDATSQAEIAYSDFRAMVEADQVDRVEYDRDNNLLLMDAGAAPQSLTSVKNGTPQSIQYIMRTQEITESSDPEPEQTEQSGENTTFFGRVAQIFIDFWNFITGLFK